MIAIIDYGMGNIFSIYNALNHVGGNPEMIQNPKELLNADGAVIPGVGAFGKCMDRLTHFREALLEIANNGTPLLGICVGMQVLFEKSEESPEKGFGWFPGEVVRLQEGLLIPHMGWNTISIKHDVDLLNGVDDNSHFYFVHSYYCIPKEKSIVAGVTEYGGKFAAVITKGNISATQFHPEKSGQMGLKILENFVRSTRC